MARCDELIALMGKRGKTVAEVAAESHVSKSTLWRWRAKGARRANAREIASVAEVLHIEPEELAAMLLRAALRVDESDDALSDEDFGAEEEDIELGADGVTLSIHGPSRALSPVLVPHWANMLRVLSRTMNLVGPRELHQVVRDELSLIGVHRAEAPQELRPGFLATEAQWSEFASWTADCLGHKREALCWLERSIALAKAAKDKPLTAYSLMRRSQQAVECGDAEGGIVFARKAVATKGISERDLALCYVREAQALALARDGKGFGKAIKAALRSADRADTMGADDDPRTVGRHCTMAYVSAHEGLGQLQLGDATTASTTITDALRHWPAAYKQDEGLARAWLALALVEDGRTEEAASEGMVALGVGAAAGSVRIMASLDRLGVQITKVGNDADIVTRFRTAHAAASQFRQ